MKKQKIIAPKIPNRAGYQVQDVWFHRAKAAGYRARSAFKLLQIQEQIHIIQPGMIILDLGCAPGSWLQVLSKGVGETGHVLGVDLQEVAKFPQQNITTVVGDITRQEMHTEMQRFLEMRKRKKFDSITCDIAPATTGRSDDDQYHSAMLCLEVLKIAEKFLAPGGSLVMKIFVGRDLAQVLKQAKTLFKRVSQIKPSACRDRSFEEYIVCREYT